MSSFLPNTGLRRTSDGAAACRSTRRGHSLRELLRLDLWSPLQHLFLGRDADMPSRINLEILKLTTVHDEAEANGAGGDAATGSAT